jgi:heme/copper-type cytochrome/quinol oxidase subunit 2
MATGTTGTILSIMVMIVMVVMVMVVVVAVVVIQRRAKKGTADHGNSHSGGGGVRGFL